jgi:hypothetical protein
MRAGLRSAGSKQLNSSAARHQGLLRSARVNTMAAAVAEVSTSKVRPCLQATARVDTTALIRTPWIVCLPCRRHLLASLPSPYWLFYQHTQVLQHQSSSMLRSEWHSSAQQLNWAAAVALPPTRLLCVTASAYPCTAARRVHLVVDSRLP